MAEVAATLWGEAEAHPAHDVLRLHGDLSLATAPRAGTLVGKLLRDRGAVVVDLAGLRLQWAAAAEVFPTVLAAAGGWPAARLVLTGADTAFSRVLHALRVHRSVPVVADPGAAHARLWQRPDRVRRHLDLPAFLGAPAAARSLVRNACADWGLGDVQDAAVLVAAELVTNVVEHTRSSCRVSVGVGPTGMTVGVRDYASGPDPRPRPMRLMHAGGRGLHIVSVLASTWGVTRHVDGKTVWAVIALAGGNRNAP